MRAVDRISAYCHELTEGYHEEGPLLFRSGPSIKRSRRYPAYWIAFAKPPFVISTRIMSPTFLFPWSRFVSFPT